MRSLSIGVLICCITVIGGRAEAATPSTKEILKGAISPETISNRLKRYVPVELGMKRGAIDPSLVKLLAPLKKAADRIDRVFWRQYSPKGWEMLQAISGVQGQAAANLASYIKLHYGPWDWHANDSPFVGARPRPPGVAFYPHDVSVREIDEFIKMNPEAGPEIWSPYTVVARKKDGSLQGIPYSKAYGTDLNEAALSLYEAADSYECKGDDCPCASLVSFLKARAQSFRDDNYRKSELLWLESKQCPLDIAIGPYEFYVDRLMGLKTAHEAIIFYRDDNASAHYAKLLDHLSGLIKNLPIPDTMRGRFITNPPSPITIADVLYTAGDARAGYQLRAFLLPNDQEVQAAKGTKNVILRNVVKAKFEHLIKPVAEQIYSKKHAKRISFRAYYDLLLAWQLSHAIAPKEITLANGNKISARQALRNRYTYIEAVHSEALALVNFYYLADKGLIQVKRDDELPLTYLANIFDSVRLASTASQALGKVMVYNFLAREWVFRYNPRSQTFEVNPPAMREAAHKLAAETLQILARGDYDGAGQLLIQYGIIPGEMQGKLSELTDVPLEILPRYYSMSNLSMSD